MRPTVLALPGTDALASRLTLELGIDRGQVEIHRFPDEEAYVRIVSPVAARPVLLAAPLHHPDDVILPLILLAATARELGATSVGLVAPYLPYLRQDRRFRTGEALSARHFANLISDIVDWITTIDPHLHRVHHLEEVYRIPSESVTAAPRLAQWIRKKVVAPLLVGPDEESRQWIEPIAAESGCPAVTLHKRRLSDTRVEIELPRLDSYRDRTPVLIDDIISTGRTVIEAARALARDGFKRCYCAAVHGIFAQGAYGRMLAAGIRTIVTCNTVPHPSNAIDVHGLLAAAAGRQLSRAAARIPVGSW
jgi:ribose-phosphate pyrophosphokinase